MSSGTWPYILNLGNSIIGVAVLAMPFCFKQCGIILGIILLLFCTWLTLVSCQLLMKAAVVSRKRSYEFLAYYTFGAPGKFVIEIGMIGLQLGTLIAQIVVIGDLGPGIVSKVFGLEDTSNLRTILIVFLCLCLGLPLGLLKDLRSVSRASTLAICFYTIFVFYVMLLSIPNLWTGNWYPKVAFWKPEGLFQTLPIFSLSFGCQTQLFLLYDSLPEPTLKSINSVISSAVNLCAVAYLLVGFFGYIAFYEQDVGGDIITLFPSTFAADMMKLFFVFSIAITFPLIIFPCRASLYTLLFPQKQKAYEDLQEEHHMPELHFKLITVAIVTGSMIIGILVPNVEFILGMNGATMGTLICYIFPALFFVRVMANKAEGKHIAQLVIGLGVLILLVSTFATLYSQDKGHTHPVPVKLEDTIVKNEVPLLDKPPEVPVVADTKNEKRVEPPVPDAPLETLEKKEDKVEKKDEDLPKKDGLDDAKDPDKDKEGKEGDVREKKDVKDDETRNEKKKEGEENVKKEELKEDVPKEEHLKEREKKIEENEHKQQVLLEKLVEQQEEQKQLINEQKQLLQELKEHKDKDHNDKDAPGSLQGQGVQQPVQGVQMQVQGVQQPVQGIQQPVQGIQQPVQGVQQPVQGVQQPMQGVQQPIQGVQQPVQGAQQPVQGVQQPVQGVQQPIQGVQQPVQEVQQPVQGAQQLVQGGQQPVQGVQQPIQGVQQPVQGVQQPVQGIQMQVQGAQQPGQGGGQQAVQGLQQQVLGVQQQIQGAQQPILGVQQPVQGVNQQQVQGVNQQAVQQQAVAQQANINQMQQVNPQIGKLAQQGIQQPIQGKQGVGQGQSQQQVLQNQQVVQQPVPQNLNQQPAQQPLQGLNQQSINQVINQPAGGLGQLQGHGQNVGKVEGQVPNAGVQQPINNVAGKNAQNVAAMNQGAAADSVGLNRQKRELTDLDDVLKEVEGIGGHIHKREVINKNLADRVVSINQGSRRR